MAMVARLGDEEYKIESQTSVVVPPGTIHAFGLRGGRVLKSVSMTPCLDTECLKKARRLSSSLLPTRSDQDRPYEI
jgi:hypothetical protein